MSEAVLRALDGAMERIAHGNGISRFLYGVICEDCRDGLKFVDSETIRPTPKQAFDAYKPAEGYKITRIAKFAIVEIADLTQDRQKRHKSVSHCRRCDLHVATIELQACHNSCGVTICPGCRVGTNDPDLAACSESCATEINRRIGAADPQLLTPMRRLSVAIGKHGIPVVRLES